MLRPKAAWTFLLMAFLLISPLSFAQEKPQDENNAEVREQVELMRQKMEEQRQSFDTQMKAMQQKFDEVMKSQAAANEATSSTVITLKGQVEAAVARMQAQEGPSAPSLIQGASRAIQSMNPDISLVGDFLAHYDSRGDKATPHNQFLLREAELSLSSYIDPYAKGDVVLSVGEDPKTHEFGIDIEEAYITLLTLPWDLLAKVGRFRVGFGKANEMHLHALPWVEYPLVIQKYFGEEGLKGDGVSISRLIPNPWDKFIELTYQVFNNDNENAFADCQSHDVTHLLHLKNFFDLSSSSTLEVGLSAATGPNNGGHGGSRTWIEGADATFKWRPAEQGKYHSLLFQNEIMAMQKDTDCGRQNSFGGYSGLEYQLAERWFAGARYDFVQCPDDSSHHENAGSVYLTFRQSEFCFWRLGAQHAVRNYDESCSKQDSQVWLQLNFSLGAHGAHKY